jgi:Tfp pilus assembly protein PilF
LTRTGGQIRDAFAALDVAARHLPPERAAKMVKKSRDHLAVCALQIAKRYLEAGEAEVALANIQAALAGRPSPKTVRRLLGVLQGKSHEFDA